MVESLKAYIGESARELVAWATGKGAQFALNLALALVIFAVGAIAIRIAAKFLRRGLEGRVKSNQMLVSFVVSVAVKAAWAFVAVNPSTAAFANPSGATP